MSKPVNGEIVIALDRSGNGKNGQVYFFPTNKAYRARYQYHLEGPGVPTHLSRFSDIPGQRIHLDPKKRLGRITDAAGDDENKHLVDGLKDAFARKEFAEVLGDPQEDIVKPNLTDEDVRKWMYWMRDAVDRKNAVVVQGTLPTLNDILKQGPVRKPKYDPRGGGHDLLNPEVLETASK